MGTIKNLKRIIDSVQARIHHPTYKRRLVAIHQRRQLKKFLEENLTKAFFKKLPRTKFVANDNLRVFEYAGKKVVIKDCSAFFFSNHGIDYELTRQMMLNYNQNIRKRKLPNRFHILRTPKVYARIGNYLIMEHIEEKRHDVPSTQVTNEEVEIYEKGLNEIRNNSKQLLNADFMKLMRKQDIHLMCTGIYQGKAVFYVPYDFD
ncbi:MAG: hypothetical protein PHQ98_02300 [Candidatus ainarchaeum sp.]|nr:hypothetical protein [Candidatus ainarchaeum sp.]